MTSFEDAVKKANELKANNGECIGRTDCFIFKGIMFDLSSCPLVVMKKDGMCIQYMDWVSKRTNSKYIKSYKLEGKSWTQYIDEDEVEE